MERGTYARALEAGFPSEQAVFMAHFGAEIRQEAVEEVEKQKRKQYQEFCKSVEELGKKFLLATAIFALGAFTGMSEVIFG